MQALRFQGLICDWQFAVFLSGKLCALAFDVHQNSVGSTAERPHCWRFKEFDRMPDMWFGLGLCSFPGSHLHRLYCAGFPWVF
jgi:hypothetical protein